MDNWDFDKVECSENVVNLADYRSPDDLKCDCEGGEFNVYRNADGILVLQCIKCEEFVCGIECFSLSSDPEPLIA